MEATDCFKDVTDEEIMVKLFGGIDTLVIPHGCVISDEGGPAVFGVFVNPRLGFVIQGGDVVNQVVHSGDMIY